jgi:hypothetical protein
MQNQEVKSSTEQEMYQVWYKAHVEQRNLQVLSRSTDHHFQGSNSWTINNNRAYWFFIFEANICARPKTSRDAYSRH